MLLRLANRNRTLAVTLAAVEARYYPQLRPHVLSLVNAKEEEWTAYVREFDANTVAAGLGATAEGTRNEADRLLLQAHSLDPLGSWYHVVKHAAPKDWDKLGGDARLAMDLRIGAELLLMFSEDLADTGRTPDPAGSWWTPLHDRLTRRTEPLETALADHGVAPGPRVVVILEGQSELGLARRVCDHMGIDSAALGLRIIAARGTGGLGSNRHGLKPVSRLAAHVLTPVIAGRIGEAYDTLQPLCAVVVATDPEEIRGTAQQLSATLLDEVLANLCDQGADDVDRGALQQLLSLTTWAEEFEFAHFTTDQIANALTEIHPDCGGLTHEEVKMRLEQCRRNKANIKSAWQGWKPEPSKVVLGNALWPALRDAIDRARVEGRDLPDLAAVLWTARDLAIGMTLARYVLPTAARKPN